MKDVATHSKRTTSRWLTVTKNSRLVSPTNLGPCAEKSFKKVSIFAPSPTRHLLQYLFFFLVNDEYRTIRGCGYINDDGKEVKPDTKLSGDCIKRAGTFSVLVQYCSCNGEDGCNHSNQIIVSSISLILPLVLVFAKLL